MHWRIVMHGYLVWCTEVSSRRMVSASRLVYEVPEPKLKTLVLLTTGFGTKVADFGSADLRNGNDDLL